MCASYLQLTNTGGNVGCKLEKTRAGTECWYA